MRSHESGSVLIAVFWLMAAMGITIFSSMVVLRSDLRVVDSEKSSFRALQLAEMGVAIAAQRGIEEYDNILKQFPVNDIAFAEFEDYLEFAPDEGFRVEIKKEAGRINPNHYLLRPTPENLNAMADVFQSWGIELSEAQEIVNCLLDWVDADEVTSAAPDGAEADWYEANVGSLNYPFNRAFYDVEEMQFVKGMDVVAAYKPNWRNYFTVRSQGPLDINDADANLIAVAAGLEEMTEIGGSEFSEDVDEIEDFLNGDSESGSYGRNGPDGVKDTNDDTPIDVNLLIEELIRLGAPSPEQLTGRFTASGNTLRIISTGIKGDYQRKLEVVLRNRGTNPSIISREEIFGK
ncbi:MAG: type II secretion system protein GspK [Verrucomicrobiales bacterium]|nr:type II secretion system protein GspK [Verrucomicrobiales bacterium]